MPDVRKPPRGERGYHDHVRDPQQRRNVHRSLSATKKARLHAAVVALKTCKGAACCATG